MKREIILPEQAHIWEKLIGKYEGEHVKLAEGRAIVDMYCDQTDKEINIGDNCVAVSVWSDYGGIPYYPWESEYIDIDETYNNESS